MIAARYAAKGIPLLVAFKDGEGVERRVGAVPPQQLRDTLECHLARASRVASAGGPSKR